MEPRRLSIALLIVGGLLLALPQVWGSLGAIARRACSRRGHPTESALRRAAEHANDGEAWLGYAEVRASEFRFDVIDHPGMSLNDPAPTAEAFAQALQLEPGSPAIRLRSALSYVDGAGRLADEQPDGSRRRPAPRSALQQQNLRIAEAQLREARALEPDNAAPDVWLAWCLYAQRRDEEAYGLVWEALGKRRWDPHLGDASMAAYRVLKLAGEWPLLCASHASILVDRHAHLKAPYDVARLLADEGTAFRLHGQHEQAIGRYLMAARLGSLVRRHSSSIAEGLRGCGASDAASGWCAERQRGETIEHLRNVEVESFASYLRAHGHGAEADWYVADMAAAEVWRADFRAQIGRLATHTSAEFSRFMALEAATWGIA
jgi:tetratricopeptide (TPR) repeat protein